MHHFHRTATGNVLTHVHAGEPGHTHVAIPWPAYFESGDEITFVTQQPCPDASPFGKLPELERISQLVDVGGDFL